MPRTGTTVIAETVQKVEVKLSARVQAQLTTKLAEFDALKARVTADTARQDAIKKEVETLFEDAGEFNALLDGVNVDGFPLKYVTGVTNTLDKQRLMRQHGLTQADLDACTDTTPKRPYLQILSPKRKKAE